MDFKIGEKVRVKRYLIPGAPGLADEIANARGEIVTISSFNGSWYRVEEINFQWSPNWLEPIKKHKLRLKE